MQLRTEALPKALQKKGLDQEIAEICDRNDIVFMAVFGSVVRGEQRRTSDIDVAIEFDKRKRKSLFDLVHVENELTRAFGRKVDLGGFQQLESLFCGRRSKGDARHL
jgi:predicted nucleotidyltransferase